MVVHVIQRQLLVYAVLAFAERRHTPPDRGDLLADTEVEAFNARRVDLPAAGRQYLLGRRQGAEHHAVAHPYQTPAPHGLDHLRIEELGPWHPTRLRGWPGGLAARRLHPRPRVRQQRRDVLPKAVRQEEGHTVGRSPLGDRMDHALRHRQRALARIDGQPQRGDGVHGRPHPLGRP